MGGFGKVLGKSVVKALKDTGKVAGSAALAAGLAVLADPASIGPLWAAVGPQGALIVLGINFAAKAALDAYKHRGDGEPEAE